MKKKWEYEKEKLQQLANEGNSLKEIGLTYGVSRERMRQIFKRLGLEQSLSIKRRKRQLAHYRRYGDMSQALYLEKKQKYYNKKHHARVLGIPFTIQFGDIEWPTHCPVLGLELEYLPGKFRSENSPSIDQLVPGKGYVPGNVKVVSWRANRIKNDGTAEEHEKIAEWMKKVLAEMQEV